MDSNEKRGNWNLQSQDHCLQKDSNCDASQYLLNEVTLNEEDLSYMFDETTPVKACGDWAYNANRSDDMNKEQERRKEKSSQSKRRRMLQFDDQELDFALCSEEMPSGFCNSNDVEDLTDVLPQEPLMIPGFPDLSLGNFEGLDKSTEGWLEECLNDTDMFFSPDVLMNVPGPSDIQIDISEFCNEPPPALEANVVKKRISQTPKNIVVKGRKSLLQTPTKLSSSVVYPFAIIKPCEFRGDVTLNDINRQIRTPPPSKSKVNDEDLAAYPTSAFSGKPVVGKTKIRTEGKGSITIMRTKG